MTTQRIVGFVKGSFEQSQDFERTHRVIFFAWKWKLKFKKIAHFFFDYNKNLKK